MLKFKQFMDLNKSEKFLTKLLYSNDVISQKDVNKLDLEKFIMLSSTHLMLPATYVNIKIKKIKNLFPKDFLDYIKFIYDENKHRNLILINETKELAKILQSNNIRYVFLKGAALILNDIYNDVGERMIGDLDFLFDKNDRVKLEILLKKNQYLKYSKFHFFEFRHIHKRTKKNKVFAIEPHLKLLSNGNLLNEKKILNNPNIKYGIKTPKLKYLLEHNILNYQVNDLGSKKLVYSHRNIYDTFMISRKINKEINLSKANEYLKYYVITQKLKIDLNINIQSKEIKFWKIFYNLLIINKNFHKSYSKTIDFIEKLKMLPKQAIEFLNNPEYRSYIKNNKF